MKIHVDRTKCSGHTMCAIAAAELYTVDDDGYSDVDELQVPPGLEQQARRGMLSCPERAITVTEEERAAGADT